MDGAVQRGGLHARTVLCPVNDRLVSLAVSSVEGQISGETVADSPWVRVRVWGCPSGDLGPWPEVRRRARLALASELVGVSRRIIDSAAVHVGSPRGPRREVLSEQAARSSLTHASAKMADVRALIAACWAEGSVEAAEWAVTVATAAQDAVAHQATTICGEIDLRSCTRCGLSYQICSDPSTPSRPTIRASVTSHERGCAGLPASPDHGRAGWSPGPAAGASRLPEAARGADRCRRREGGPLGGAVTAPLPHRRDGCLQPAATAGRRVGAGESGFELGEHPLAAGFRGVVGGIAQILVRQRE